MPGLRSTHSSVICRFITGSAAKPAVRVMGRTRQHNPHNATNNGDSATISPPYKIVHNFWAFVRPRNLIVQKASDATFVELDGCGNN